MKLFIIFILANIFNVIIQTIKTLVTVKGGKTISAVTNALAYGFYTYIVVLMVCELPLFTKCLIVGLCNLIGVYIVKLIEEKTQKEKLYKIECSFKKEYLKIIDKTTISHNYIDIGNYVIFNFFCKTKEEKEVVKSIIYNYNGKYFATETKIL